ncbi:hypothetical protein [Pelagovum pacificum]|nr:hypothetical protein [Pelagovum pacificum]QQA44341.1 hypothetical protein I8N54_07145 [Pelagovum pacificum]
MDETGPIPDGEVLAVTLLEDGKAVTRVKCNNGSELPEAEAQLWRG